MPVISTKQFSRNNGWDMQQCLRPDLAAIYLRNKACFSTFAQVWKWSVEKGVHLTWTLDCGLLVPLH